MNIVLGCAIVWFGLGIVFSIKGNETGAANYYIGSIFTFSVSGALTAFAL